jgi:hypothetical protein
MSGLHFIDLSFSKLPRWALISMLNRVVGSFHIALCFHRFKPFGFKYFSFTCSDPDATDDLLNELKKIQKKCKIHITIDDGYADAIDFSRNRAGEWSRGMWINFVCPLRCKKSLGFRWDVKRKMRDDGAMTIPNTEVPVGNLVLELERAELLEIGRDLDFKISTLEEIKNATRQGLAFGNHGTFHFKYNDISDSDVKLDLELSKTHGEGLGSSFLREFAFPFGTPEAEFSQRHFDMVKERGYLRIWSTESRPFTDEEFEKGSSALPRFAINGRWSVNLVLARILLRTLRFRWQRMLGKFGSNQKG